MLRSFFVMEKQQAGWRFWLFWVIMTNIGFFSGIWFSNIFADLVEPGMGLLMDKVIQNTVSALIIGCLTGLSQGIVLGRHGVSSFRWTIATTLGWAAGIFLAGYFIFTLDITIQTSDFFRWIVPSAFIAGAVTGISQWAVLRQTIPTARWWWILVSALGWGIQFPGMVPGLVLVRLLR